MYLLDELMRRAASSQPVRVGLIGAGKFGSMFLSQVPTTPGLTVCAIADLDPAHVGADLDHVARHLVTQNQRLAHREIANPPLKIVVQVRATDPSSNGWAAAGTSSA